MSAVVAAVLAVLCAVLLPQLPRREVVLRALLLVLMTFLAIFACVLLL